MSYTLPVAAFQQEFQLLASAVQQILNVCVIGPKKKVVKDGLSTSDETDYGAYDPDSDAELALLALPTGESVDAGSVSVTLRSAYGRYASLSGTDVIEATGTPNEIKLGSGAASGERLQAFDDGTTTHDRLAALGANDVQVGHYANIVHEDGTMRTKITGLVQEVTAATVDVTSPNDSANPATQSATAVSAIVDDKSTSRTAAHYAATPVASNYTGDLAQGHISDVYTMEITKAGALGTAEFSVTSTNGDNATGVVTPADNATAVAIGSNGLEVLMDDATAPFVLGEKWTLTVGAAYTQKTITVSTATYTGTTDTVYQVKVVKGGLYASNPKVSVTTNTNVDSSPAVAITGDAVDFDLGSIGPEIQFDDNADPQGGLLLGDIYNVIVTAAKDDGARTLQLQDPLPQLDSGDSAINASGTDLSVTLSAKADSTGLPAGDYPDTGDLNWVEGTDTVTMKSGVEINIPGLVDGSADPLSLPVEAAEVSIYYTATLALEANQLGSVETQADVPGDLGDVVPENSLAYGVDKAAANAAGVPVYYITTAGDSADDYTAALAEAEKREAPYFIVPTSDDLAVQDLVRSHVIAMSSVTGGLERIAVVSRSVASELDLFVTRDNDTAWTGYVAVGPELSPAQYRKVTVPGATFVTDGVSPGDAVRTNYSIAASGAEVYETYTVESVTDEENLLITEGPDGPVGSVGNLHRLEVAHPYTSQEAAELAAAQSEYFGDRRVTNIFPDTAVDTLGNTVAGYNLAAAYAGLKSSVAPHQPITNMVLAGFGSVPRSLNEFSREELNTIAAGGTAIIGQGTVGGALYVRHQLTTDMTDVNHSELSITTNVDSIARYLRPFLNPLIGQYNINSDLLLMLETLTAQRLDFMVQETRTLKAGQQILEVGAIRATQDELNRTKVILEVPLSLPYALNELLTRLIIQ